MSSGCKLIFTQNPIVSKLVFQTSLNLGAPKSWEILPLRFSLNCILCNAAAGKVFMVTRGGYLIYSLILLTTLPSLCISVQIVPLCKYTYCIYEYSKYVVCGHQLLYTIYCITSFCSRKACTA